MEFIVIVVSIVSVATNYLIFRHINNLQINVYVPEPQPIVIREVVESETLQPTPSPTVRDESHFAWRNQNNIPIGPARMTPTGSPSPPETDPLDRPAGFYR